jgi:hypothetical protein
VLPIDHNNPGSHIGQAYLNFNSIDEGARQLHSSNNSSSGAATQRPAANMHVFGQQQTKQQHATQQQQQHAMKQQQQPTLLHTAAWLMSSSHTSGPMLAAVSFLYCRACSQEGARQASLCYSVQWASCQVDVRCS